MSTPLFLRQVVGYPPCMRYLFLFLAGTSLLACSSSSTTEGSGGGSTTTSTGTSTGTGPACSGSTFSCAESCGSDNFPAEAECKNGQWVCPSGTVNPDSCPPGTCWGLPLPCEVCTNGWACEPNPTCLGGCPSIVCAECPADGQPIDIPGCSCTCDPHSQFVCTPTGTACCTTPTDCGDKTFTPCVEGVCKEPVLGACWVDEECPAGQKCVGATVCPCGVDCLQPDKPGQCMP